MDFSETFCKYFWNTILEKIVCQLKVSKKQVQIKELENKGGSKRKAKSYFILLNKSFKKKRGKPQAKQKTTNLW